MFKTLTIFFLLLQLTSCKNKIEEKIIMTDSTKKYTNRLIKEKSPYLLQHAHNPVNWFPWGEEAFKLAKDQNKPIFLSIGYSTCHWCHVMEHESFEDEVVANLMNENFISIKVDREERPDIDNIYMQVCQMLTGRGGWPMTIIMTPDQKPFFAGTYFPKNSLGGRMGLLELIPKIKKAWEEQNEEIYKSANEITNHLSSSFDIANNNSISKDILNKAYSTFESRFDSENGGFGTKPKFPSPHNLSFLLRASDYSDSKNKSTQMVIKTLKQMRNGGIFDQIGYGFHRYSTDSKWFLPHFEKMLYDQAMLTIAYTEAYQLTKIDLFKQTVEEVLTYVSRDMTSADGGFYSAEDADSDGEEGKFYVWSKKEILNILGQKDGDFISKIFNVKDNGNFSEEASGHPTGKNIFFLSKDSKTLADEFGMSVKQFSAKLDSLRTILFNERKKRIHPHKDDKILTDWNGLMIVAFAKAARTLGNDEYSRIAEKSIKFIYSKLISEDDKLLHRFRDGDAAIDAQIDDYAFLIWGLIETYETTFKYDYLQKAINLSDHLIKDFWDTKNNSGFFSTSELDSKLISRPKEFYDGAIPSGNSVMFSNLIKLNKFTTKNTCLEYSRKIGNAFTSFTERNPSSFSQFLIGVDFYFGPSFEIIIVGDKDSKATKEMIETINSNFIPNKVVMLINDQNKNELNKIAPFTKDYITSPGETTVYVCKNYVCSLPTTNKNKVLELLKQ